MQEWTYDVLLSARQESILIGESRHPGEAGNQNVTEFEIIEAPKTHVFANRGEI